MKNLIKNSEDRLTCYKNMLKEVNGDHDSFPKEDECVILYKQILRELKNTEQVYLKGLIEERTNENEGLNPPYLYTKYHRNKKEEI